MTFNVGAKQHDHITERAWLEDATGRLVLSDVQQQSPVPYEGILSKGYGHSVIWLRLRIDPGKSPVVNQETDQLVLRIRPVYLDDIQVFDPLVQGLAGKTGDVHHPRLDTLQGIDFLLPIARGTETRDIWLRLASTSTRQIDVQALSMDDLAQRTRVQELVFSGYIGLILIFAVWGMVHWVFSREHLIGYFSVSQTAAFFYALCSLGYMRIFWPMDWPAAVLNQITTFFSITAVSAAVLFHVLLLREFNLPNWIKHLHIGMVSLLPIKLFLMTNWAVSALRINMIEVLIAPTIFLISAWFSRAWDSKHTEQNPPLSRAVVLIFYLFLVAALAIAALAGLGLAKSGEIALHIVQIHGLITAFFVLLMLQYRSHVMIQQRHQISLELERSQLQAQQERAIREEQDKLLTMLAHELKTPLATMHMRLDSTSSGSLEIKKAIREMNSVIERCIQTTQLGDKQLTAQIDLTDLVDVVKDAVSCCHQPERVKMNLPAQLQTQTDRQLLFIVLNNLLENACKYAEPGTNIWVNLSAMPPQTSGEPHLRLEVCNSPGSSGWPEPDKVFEKYYRSPHAKRQAGTGLGLFLVRNLMTILGGRIDYLPNETSIQFVLMLPLSHQPS